MSFSNWTIATRINSKRRNKRVPFNNYKERFKTKGGSQKRETLKATKEQLESIRVKMKKEQKKIFILRLLLAIIVSATIVYTVLKFNH